METGWWGRPALRQRPSARRQPAELGPPEPRQGLAVPIVQAEVSPLLQNPGQITQALSGAASLPPPHRPPVQMREHRLHSDLWVQRPRLLGLKKRLPGGPGGTQDLGRAKAPGGPWLHRPVLGGRAEALGSGQCPHGTAASAPTSPKMLLPDMRSSCISATPLGPQPSAVSSHAGGLWAEHVATDPEQLSCWSS